MRKYFSLAIAAAHNEVATGGSWGSALWTFPSVLFSAMLIAWGAEAAQFLISQGMALAILAWLQTLPEFAVEAVIAFEAGKDPAKIHLITANFTGSLRLLTGLGWPMIYATAAIFKRKKQRRPLREIDLEQEHCVEVVGLLVPILYFFWIYLKSTLTVYDSVVLIVIYFAYLYVLRKIPSRDEEEIEELEYIPKKILSYSRRVQISIITGLFVGGGVILYFVAHPFLESMLAVAISLGVNEFVFVQWVAPFLSEFPEKVSAFHWARQVRSAPMALMNMVSSNINQWTMLVAMIPIVYGFSAGDFSGVHFDDHQREEILLTLAQALVGFIFLLNMRFSWYEAVGLFVLWLIQFVQPQLRSEIMVVYFAWFAIELIRTLITNQFKAFPEFVKIFRLYVLGSPKR
ncbi:MAG TPA: hypothetical protein VFG11_07170 [Acidobacteriota bacterium]|nr:hypothetical protein [Acidobacteriota bacterium]